MGKFPIYDVSMGANTLHAAAKSVTPQALAIMQPLVSWLLRSGVGYAEFATELKPLFLEAALAEQRRIGGKQTDSALSLASGLHRKDVRTLTPEIQARRARGDADAGARLGKPTPPSEVVTRWLTRRLPRSLPFAGPTRSFERLARSVSKDIHPRSVLQEMVRLGVAEEKDGMVTLRKQAFVPDAKRKEARELLAGSVADHLAAGVHNLTGDPGKTFLEQSVFADGLSRESAKQLETLANSLWRHVLEEMVKAAVPLCKQDEPSGGNRRIRLGMFCFSAPMQGGDAPAAASGSQTGYREERAT